MPIEGGREGEREVHKSQTGDGEGEGHKSQTGREREVASVNTSD